MCAPSVSTSYVPTPVQSAGARLERMQRSSTIRTAIGMRIVSDAPNATSRWPASRSAPETMARSCVASVARERMATAARAATRW